MIPYWETCITGCGDECDIKYHGQDCHEQDYQDQASVVPLFHLRLKDLGQGHISEIIYGITVR